MSDQPPSGQPPTATAGPGHRSPQRRIAVWVAISAAAVLVLGGAATTTVLLNRQDPTPTATVTLEPARVAGSDPFLAAVAITEVTSFPDSVQAVASTVAAGMSTDPSTGALSVTGTTDNLYGGRQNQNTQLYGGSGKLGECDVPALSDYLANNPEKAAAWAAARNITPDQINDYLATLTPVVLLHDTLVTNFGYHAGVATPRQSVLQAGTAVLVDWTGMPVVRCACGNPLAAPSVTSLSTAQLQGTRWDGYDPARTVTVTPGPVAAGLVLLDVATGQSYTRPVGTAPLTTTTPAPTTPPRARRSASQQPPPNRPPPTAPLT